MKDYLILQKTFRSTAYKELNINVSLYFHLEDDNETYYYRLVEKNDKDEILSEDKYEADNLEWAVDMVNNILMGYDHDIEMIREWEEFHLLDRTIPSYPYVYTNDENKEVTVTLGENGNRIKTIKLDNNNFIVRTYTPYKEIFEEFVHVD